VVGSDGTQSRTIDSVTDVDWVRFDVVAGNDYSIRTSSAGGVDPDTRIRLYDSTQTEINSNNDIPGSYFARLNFTAATTETLYARVSDSYGETGEYNLLITDGADTAPPVYPVPPSFSPGVANAGDTVTITVELADATGVAEASIDIYSPAGLMKEFPLTTTDGLNWTASFVVPSYFPDFPYLDNLRVDDVLGNGQTYNLTPPPTLDLAAGGTVTEDTSPPTIDLVEFRIAGSKVTSVSSGEIFDIIVAASDAQSEVASGGGIQVEIFDVDSGVPLGTTFLSYNKFEGHFEGSYEVVVSGSQKNVVVSSVQGLPNALGYIGSYSRGVQYNSDVLTVNP
jgi:hypothetical protein